MYSQSMSLVNFDVPFHEGRVCYATDSASGCKATVECYGLNRAFLVVYDRRHPLRVGDWVRFRGRVRLNMRIKKNGEIEERLQYYHDPHDGSPRQHWVFFELHDPEVSIVAPPDVLSALKDAMVQARRHVDSWTANSGAESLRRTVASLEAAADALRPVLRQQVLLEEDRGAAIAALDITL